MNKRIPAIISTVSNGFCDFTLDIAINKFNVYLILLYTALGSFVIHLIYGVYAGFVFTNKSIIYILLYGICMLLGYIFYVMSLKRIPVALAALIESGTLFVYLLIDGLCGFIKINFWFIFLFCTFLFSIYLFSYDTYKFKSFYKNKSIKLSGILILLFSMFFYGLEPYLIKIASLNGANEVVINIGYFLLAIPFFLIMLKKTKIEKGQIKNNKSNIVKYIILISLFEAIYFIFGTIGYINEVAIINGIIQELRVFILFILSFIFANDKITIKKVISIILGMISVIGIYLY